MDEVRYYSLRWDGNVHYIEERDKYDLLICIYRGYHRHKQNVVVLYPFKIGNAYGDIQKKEIDISQIMPKEWRFRKLG